MMVLITSTTCFASQPNDISAVLNGEFLNSSSEKTEILNVVKNDKMAQSIIDKNKTKQLNTLKEEKIIKAYKFNTPDIVSSYKTDKNFSKLISNKHVWLTVIPDIENKELTFAKIDKGMTVDEFNNLPMKFNSDKDKNEALEKIKINAGKWNVAQIGSDFTEDQISFVTDKEQIEKFLMDNGIKKPSQIKLLLAESHFTNILYIKDGADEYGIPFSSRPDFSGLENGKLYKISDIMNALSKISIYGATTDNTLNGGSTTGYNTHSTKVAITTFLSISIVALILAIYYKKFKRLHI